MGVPRGAGPLVGPTLCCCLLLLRLCGARPGDHCRTIDCMLHRREHCASGSDVCGPCLQGFTDTGGLTCEDATQKEKDTIPNLDQEIDNLASILSRQGSQSLQLADAGNKATSSESPPPPPPPNVTPSGRNGEQPSDTGGPQERRRDPLGDGLLLGVVIACAVSGLVALLVAGICWCRMRREMKLAAKADYPAFKSSSPPPYDKISPGDKKLAQNAQMYHYQHQKQQMLSMEKNKDEPKHTDSAVTSDEENEDGDYTVYECPGLAPTGEMEVKNPLFDDSSHQPAHKAT